MLVLPRSRSDTTESIIPIKIIEAFALGIPVIITSHKVLLDLCKDKDDVLFVSPNPEDIAEKLILLISNEEIRKRLGSKGPEIAKNFDYQVIANRLLTSLNPNNMT
jgi:glycosyltransferase involved in cell wall biosynthesis